MSIICAERHPTPEPLLYLSAAEIDAINAALGARGVPWALDPYADKKLDRANVQQIIDALSASDGPDICQKLRLLLQSEAVYWVGC